MNVKNLLLAFFLGAFVAGGISYLVLRGTADAGSLDARRAPVGDDASIDPIESDSSPLPGGSETASPTLKGASGASEHLADLEQRNEALQTEVAQLMERIEQLQPKPKDPRAFRFGLPEQSPSFDGADWPQLATSMQKLAPMLHELRRLITEGGGPTLQWRTEAQKHNGPLAAFALKVNADLDDEKAASANAAYTHPAVFANLMRASLAAANLPLSDDQEVAIQALGDAWEREQDRSAAALPAGVPMLKHTVLRVDSKLRFLNSVRSVLTTEQDGVLFHPETEGRMHIDLLSPVLVYSPVIVQIDATDRATMEEKLLKQLLESTGTAAEDVSKFAWVGREWVDAIPGATDPQPLSSVEFRCPHVDIVQARARAQVQATERILAMGGLTEEQAAALRAVNVLLYPFIIQRGS